jgi:ATP-dependent Clp protease adapter protein ClpS
MIEVHTLGRSMVFTGPVGEATNYCVQLHVSGLQAIIEKAS